VRIVAQLLDTTTGGHIWSERYDRPLKDIFALQDEVVQKIVTTLKLQLTLWEQGIIVRKTTDNLEAYDSYLRGMESYLRASLGGPMKEVNEQARQLFERAIELDPMYGQAYIMLGWTYFIEWFWGWNRDPQLLDRALELAQRATALDDSLPGAHGLSSEVYKWKKQPEQAIAAARRVIALDPNAADGYDRLGNVLAFAGQPEEGIGLIEKGLRLNPHYGPWNLHVLAIAYRVAERYEEAITAEKRALTRKPDFFPAYYGLTICYAELGRETEARAAAAEVLRLNPNFSVEFQRQFLPFKDQAVLERELAALRKAGLK
jgi:adenylate cyclase